MSRTVFTPGDEPEPVAALRAEYGGSVAENTLAIRTVTLVGARHQASWLGNDDLDWLQCSLEACRRHGIAVAEDFAVQPLNIALRDGVEVPAGERNEEEDFLKQAIPSDLVVSCFLPGPRCKDGSHPAMRLSTSHQEDDAWPAAARRNGTMVITAFWFDDRDLQIKHFAQPDFTRGMPAFFDDGAHFFEMGTLIRSSVPHRPVREKPDWRSRYQGSHKRHFPWSRAGMS